MRLELNYTEMRVNALKGIDRNLRTIYEHRHRGGGQPEDRGWTDHITGALAEAAVAKALNLYPSCNNRDTKTGDVGGYQVRSTTHYHGHLIVYPYDRDDAVFILVVGLPPTLTIVGWMRGGEAKQPQWEHHDPDAPPCWWAPQPDIHPLDTLPPPA